MDTIVKPASDADTRTLPGDVESLRQAISRHLIYTVGKDALAASSRDWLYALSTAVRDRLIERWIFRRARKMKASHVQESPS